MNNKVRTLTPSQVYDSISCLWGEKKKCINTSALTTQWNRRAVFSPTLELFPLREDNPYDGRASSFDVGNTSHNVRQYFSQICNTYADEQSLLWCCILQKFRHSTDSDMPQQQSYSSMHKLNEKVRSSIKPAIKINGYKNDLHLKLPLERNDDFLAYVQASVNQYDCDNTVWSLSC